MQLLDDLEGGGEEYIQKLKKKETLDGTLWITCFGQSSAHYRVTNYVGILMCTFPSVQTFTPRCAVT